MLQHTLPPVAIAVQILALAYLVLTGEATGARDRRPILVQTSLLLLAVFCFRSALGRSDAGHVMYSSPFAFLGLGHALWLLTRNRLSIATQRACSLLCASSVLWVVASSHWLPAIDSGKIAGFKARLSSYVSLPDRAFLPPKLTDGIERLKEIFAKEPGVFVYTSEAALPYLLKKPSFDRNYIVWFCSASRKQEEIIEKLERAKPAFIVYDSPCWTNTIDGIRKEERFRHLHRYLQTHYEHLETVADYWVVWKRRHRP